jgi:hypothetical protein
VRATGSWLTLRSWLACMRGLALIVSVQQQIRLSSRRSCRLKRLDCSCCVVLPSGLVSLLGMHSGSFRGHTCRSWYCCFLTRTSFRILKSAQSDSYSTFNQLMVVHVPKEVSSPDTKVHRHMEPLKGRWRARCRQSIDGYTIMVQVLCLITSIIKSCRMHSVVLCAVRTSACYIRRRYEVGSNSDN